MARKSVSAAVLFSAAAMCGCVHDARPGTQLDEAMRAHRTVESLRPAADDLYFHDMDGGLTLSPQAIKGRNKWLVWTGGTDRLWDTLTAASLGSFDLLKILTEHSGKHSRDDRWQYLGLVNEPCFRKATAPDPNRYGLWLDVRDPACEPDPFANAEKYKGVEIGARGKTVPVGSLYGEPSGIVGLRLFTNPDFDENARKAWNSEKYYNDPDYYYSSKLVRPYRVGMTCAFCHVGPNPLKPPADPEHPRWENLSSNVGAQYFWVDRIFNWKGDANASSFLFQLLHTSRPGSLDTSLVSTDNINNPRTMNAVYYLLPRMLQAKKWGKETLAGGGLNNKQLNDFVPPTDALAQFFAAPSTTWTPRVLKDGSDSVGALGALNRVYLNIGLFSEEWLTHFRPFIGGKPISPIEIAVARKHSAYWQSTEEQTINMAVFFLESTNPHRLSDAPGGDAYLRADAPPTVDRGKVVFAERCARCHSSKTPPLPAGLDLENANGKNYLNSWNQYWAWSKTEDFKRQMRPMVQQPDFLKDNYLSTELRVPVTLLQTNACSPLATNAIKDNIWDNFSSASYKELPSVGTITFRDPMSGKEVDKPYVMPAGGRGYVRPASLVSVWSTAPFLQNNTVGPFEWEPSVAARMRSFQASIEQLLWPERRPKDPIFGSENGPGVGIIDRTTEDSYIDVPNGFVPDALRGLIGAGRRLFPFFFHEGSIRIGPFPKGMPVNLLANADLLGADLPLEQRLEHQRQLLGVFKDARQALKPGATLESFKPLADRLLKLSKCADFVVNKGHYFGTDYLRAEEPGLSDDDKKALIAFVKTF
jgi:hypothetical protein